ncbi:MAG: 2-succinyl-6-hydroxy-2,4-cyclohexadiene-1-carboxylate synthase [Bacillus sp. (in: firmicutes)]
MFIDCNGVSYYVKIKGEGEPLVLLHGFTGSHETWDTFADRHSDSYMCIMPDLLGHGKTCCPGDENRYRIEQAADDLYCLLKELKIGQANILGYSMGGRLALSYSVRYPETVKRLILESSSPGLKTEEERLSRTIQDSHLASQILKDGIIAFVDYWERIPLFRSQERLPEKMQRKIRCQRLMNSEIGLANSLLGMGTGMQPSYWDALNMIDCPVLLISGGADQKFCRIAEEMQKDLADCTLIKFEEAGHAIHVEDYEKFDRIVSEFVEHRRENTNGY